MRFTHVSEKIAKRSVFGQDTELGEENQDLQCLSLKQPKQRLKLASHTTQLDGHAWPVKRSAQLPSPEQHTPGMFTEPCNSDVKCCVCLALPVSGPLFAHTPHRMLLVHGTACQQPWFNGSLCWTEREHTLQSSMSQILHESSFNV